MYTYISEKIITRISTVQLREDNVLHIDIKADELFDVNDMHELIEAAYKIGDGKRFVNLITVGEHTIADGEARTLSTSEEGSRYKIADAFVIHSLSQVLVGNFYMKVHKPCVPTRFFKKLEDAEEWLKQFK